MPVRLFAIARACVCMCVCVCLYVGACVFVCVPHLEVSRHPLEQFLGVLVDLGLQVDVGRVPQLADLPLKSFSHLPGNKKVHVQWREKFVRF